METHDTNAEGRRHGLRHLSEEEIRSDLANIAARYRKQLGAGADYRRGSEIISARVLASAARI